MLRNAGLEPSVLITERELKKDINSFSKCMSESALRDWFIDLLDTMDSPSAQKIHSAMKKAILENEKRFLENG